MAYLYRLGAGLLCVLTLGMVWTPAHAAPGWSNQPGGVPCYASFSAGLSAWMAGHNVTVSGVTYSYTVTTSNSTAGTFSGTFTAKVVSTGAVNGPNGFSDSLTACIYVDPDAGCQGVALLDSTAFGNRDVQIPGQIDSGEACMPFAGSAAGTGCKVAFARDVSYRRDGAWISEGTYSFPGATSALCTVAGAPRPAEVDTCKGGQPGQVNGVTVCVPFSPSTPTVSDTNKDSSTTGPSGTETKSEVKNTVCDSGSCSTTTTTTTTNSTGTSVSTNTTKQGKGEYCAATPGAKECAGKSSFSGSCAGGFVGDGDALQVAIAREQYKRNCEFYENPTEQAKFDTEAAKTGKQYTEDTVAISSASFSQTNLLGVGAQCITDKTITVMTATVVLPFSRVCSSLDQLGVVLLGVSFIAALMIVAKGKD
jgi:hypothetical protein